MKKMSKKNNSINILIAITSFIVLLFILSNVFGFEIQSISSILLSFAIFAILYPLVIMIVKIISYLFKKNKILIGIGSIVLLFSVIMFVSGMVIFFQSTPFSGEYEVDDVKVVDSSWNKVQIDYTKYNHDDYKLISIKKPFFIKVNSGDTIKVRYPVNKPNKMVYVIDNEVGLGIIGISTYIFIILIAIVLFVIIIYVIKNAIERKNKYGKE